MNSNIWIVFILIWTVTSCQNDIWKISQDCITNATCYNASHVTDGGINPLNIKQPTRGPPKPCRLKNNQSGFCYDFVSCEGLDESEFNTDSNECPADKICCLHPSKRSSKLPPRIDEFIEADPATCISDNGQDGACVYTNMCNTNNNIKHSSKHSRNGYSTCKHPKICCRHSPQTNDVTINNQIPPTYPAFGGFPFVHPFPLVNVMYAPVYLGFLVFLVPYQCPNSFNNNGQSCNYVMNFNPGMSNVIPDTHDEENVYENLDEVFYNEQNQETPEPLVMENNRPMSCLTSSGHEGACVESRSCNANSTVEQFGESYIKHRDGSEECEDLLVCCRVPSEEKEVANKYPAQNKIPMKENKYFEKDINRPISCLTNSGHEGACVEFNLCSTNGTVEEHGESRIKSRDGSEECEDSLVCCRVPSEEKEVANKYPAQNKIPMKENKYFEKDISRPMSCMTSSGHEGACVEFNLCSINGTIELFGESSIKSRDGFEECEDSLVCCRVPSEEKEVANKEPASIANAVIRGEVSTKISNAGEKAPESCTTDAGKRGVCVKSNMCNENDTIKIYDGDFIIPRIGSEECENDKICCVFPEDIPPKAPKKKKNETATQKDKQINCGRINSKGIEPRVSNSEKYETVFGEYPWVVGVISSMFTNGDISNTFLGGGSLIHPRAVLTTAHTVKGYEIEDIIIRAGDWDSSKQCDSRPGCKDSPDESHLHQDRTLEKIVIHEHFSEGGLLNDIAILVLSHDLNIGDNIGLLCLPPPAVEAPPANCITAGWGIFNGSENAEILKKVELPIVRRSECEKIYKTTVAGIFFKMHESFICAGGVADMDACRGNGGSPLMCPMPNNPNIYMQSGIVSWGLECGTPGIPTVYTNVAHFRKWIDDKLFDNALYY